MGGARAAARRARERIVGRFVVRVRFAGPRTFAVVLIAPGALARAVAVGFFGLVMKKQLRGRKRQVKALLRQNALEGFERLVFGLYHLAPQRRINPKTHFQVDAKIVQLAHQHLRRWVWQHHRQRGQLLLDGGFGRSNVVTVADAQRHTLSQRDGQQGERSYVAGDNGEVPSPSVYRQPERDRAADLGDDGPKEE